MNYLKKQILFIGLFCVSVNSIAQTPVLKSFDLDPVPFVRNIAVKDFFKNPEFTNPKISPDGKSVAYLGIHLNRMNLFISSSEILKGTPATNNSNSDVIDFFWENNNFIVLVRKLNGSENTFISGYDITTGLESSITDNGYCSRILHEVTTNEEVFLIETNKRIASAFDVYQVNAKTLKVDIIEQNAGNILKWFADNSGQVRLAISSGQGCYNLLKKNASKIWEGIVRLNYGESIIPLAFTGDNLRQVYCSTNVRFESNAIVKYEIENWTPIETVFQQPGIDVNEIYYSNKRKELYDVYYQKDKLESVFMSEFSNTVHASIKLKMRTNDDFQIVDWNKDESKLMIKTLSDVSMGAYFIYSVYTDELTPFGESMPWLEAKMMRHMKPISFTTSTGSEIHGYLTLPFVGDKNLPTVVLVHDGPMERDVWGFDPEVQLYASRGFAVLQLNYIGSSGYGRNFQFRGNNNWSLEIQSCIAEGVKHLVNEGIADANNIAIVGHGFGGYSAVMNAAKYPELYCCAVSISGITDLNAYLNNMPSEEKLRMEEWKKIVGNPEEDIELFVKGSLSNQSVNIEDPVLFVLGAKDGLVSVENVNNVAGVIKENNVLAEVIVNNEEAHEFVLEQSKIDLYLSVDKFLNRNVFERAATGIAQPVVKPSRISNE